MLDSAHHGGVFQRVALDSGIEVSLTQILHGAGAKIALVKAPVGVMDRRHTHPEANQFAMRLTGSMKWVSSYIPKGEERGRSMVEEETIAIFFWDDPPKPEVVE